MKQLIILLFKNLFSTKPVSKVFGLDRGIPIDRYYIEKFLEENKQLVKGDVLEIADNTYSLKYGEERLKKSLIITLEPNKDYETIDVNLEDKAMLHSSIADCFILTQTLLFTFDVQQAAINAFQLLKPGGTLLITLPGITQLSRYDYDRWGQYWSFTDKAIHKLFGSIVPEDCIVTKTYGNVKAASAFLYGMALKDISTKDLEKQDADYQMVITAIIRKPLTASI